MPANPEVDFLTSEEGDLYEKCWYESTGSRYWTEIMPEIWVSKNETQMRRWLVGEGVKAYVSPEDAKAGIVQSELDVFLKRVESYKQVAWSGVLAGQRAGIHEMRGAKILVTESPKPIQPAVPLIDAGVYLPDDEPRPWDDICKGCHGWPLLGHFLRNLFSCNRPGTEEKEEEVFDQRHYFFAWLQRAMESLYACNPLRGHAMLLAGEPGCGKSLTCEIIAEMMGGRVARPLRWIFGLTQFNSDMFPAPLLLIDDEGAKTHIADRKELSAKVKQIVAVRGGAMEGKHKDALELISFKRLIMATNLEEQNLLVFPPIDDDIRDKVMLFKAYDAPWPWGENLDEEEIWEKLSSEIPYFLHWLIHDFEIPEEIRSQRFGCTEWLHPEILAGIDYLSPEVRLMGWIDRAILTKQNEWEGVPLPAGHWKGSSVDIEIALKSPESGLTHKERERVPPANPTIGKFLSSLSKKQNFSGRIKQVRTATWRGWEIISEETYAKKRHENRKSHQENDTRDF